MKNVDSIQHELVVKNRRVIVRPITAIEHWDKPTRPRVSATLNTNIDKHVEMKKVTPVRMTPDAESLGVGTL